MIGSRSPLVAQDYNSLQTQVAAVLGDGQSQGGPVAGWGYGQAVRSSQVTAKSKITAQQWNSLLADLDQIYTHQVGASTGIIAVVTGRPIIAAYAQALANAVTQVTTNKLTAATGQQSVGQFASTGDTRTLLWGYGSSDVKSVYTITFASAQDMAYYFSQGGSFRLAARVPVSPSTPQDQAWAQLITAFFAGMPSVSYTAYAQLTAQDSTFRSQNGSGTYAGLSVTVSLRLNAALSSATQLLITVTFQDNYTGASDVASSGFGYDVYKNTIVGAFTGIQPQSGQVTTTFDSKVVRPPATYSLESPADPISEGATTNFVVNTTNLDDGTVLYWGITGSVTGVDFSPIFVQAATSAITVMSGGSANNLPSQSLYRRTSAIAVEDSVVLLAPGTVVAYGVSGKYYAQRVGSSGAIGCDSITFGDPNPGTAKKCFLCVDPSTPLPTGTVTINNNAAVIPIYVSADVSVGEGDEPMTLVLYTDSARTSQVAAVSVTVKDTSTKSFPNFDFSAGPLTQSGSTYTTPGWTVYAQQVYSAGLSTVAGWPTPVDPTPAGPGRSSPTDTRAATSVSFTAQLTTDVPAGSAANAKGLQLISKGNTVAYGIVRGPYVVSDPVTLAAGDVVTFYWKAEGGVDAYSVFGYLVNTANGSTILILDSTGKNAGVDTAWAPASVTIAAGQAGDYRFVFLSGSFDATGGKVTGASLYITNIVVTAP